MKTLQDHEAGSWKKAITCADGVWLTKGYHSTNGSATVRNYQNNSLWYYTHNFLDANILFSGGHFNRSFGKSLEKLKQSKTFSTEKLVYYSNLFPTCKLDKNDAIVRISTTINLVVVFQMNSSLRVKRLLSDY